MSYKQKAEKLIKNTAQPLINNAIGLVANRTASKSTMGKIIKYVPNPNTIPSPVMTVADFVDVMMADGTVVKNCQMSGSRPMGINSTVVVIDGVLF